MKKLLAILVLGLLLCNFALALNLPKDVASGNTYKKSLDKKYKISLEFCSYGSHFKYVLILNVYLKINNKPKPTTKIARNFFIFYVY